MFSLYLFIYFVFVVKGHEFFLFIYFFVGQYLNILEEERQIYIYIRANLNFLYYFFIIFFNVEERGGGGNGPPLPQRRYKTRHSLLIMVVSIMHLL